MTEDSTFALVLGEMQDAGLPHIGCRCAACTSGRIGYVASLAIIDATNDSAAVFLLDATPDIRPQLALLAGWLGAYPGRRDRYKPPNAVFLSHAHIGHIGGLPQFGPEAMSVEQLPVYGSAGMLALLRETRMWQPLIEKLALRAFVANRPMRLTERLTLTPVPVPHRDEAQTGTFAFVVAGPNRRLLYLPDIDDWDAWSEGRQVVAGIDVAVVDGSFYTLDELKGRPPAAHPSIEDTLAFFTGWDGELVFTHMNHTNPVLIEGSPAILAVERTGARLARTGMRVAL